MSEEAQITVSVPGTDRVVKMSRQQVLLVHVDRQNVQVHPVPEAIVERFDGFVNALETIREMLAPEGEIEGKALLCFREIVQHIVKVCDTIPPEAHVKGMQFQIDDLKTLTSGTSMDLKAFKLALLYLIIRLKGVVKNMRMD